MKLKFGLKISLEPNSYTKTDFNTKLKTERQFHTKVYLNNPVLNRTCTMHLDR